MLLFICARSYTFVVQFFFFFLMIRRPPRSTLSSSSAASDVYKRQYQRRVRGTEITAMSSKLGCCEVMGMARRLDRAELMKYRSWSYLAFLFNVKGSVIPEVWPWCIFYAVWALGVAMFDAYITKIEIAKDAHTLFIVPVAFLLAFRSNTAYARFWEGRGHFGTFNFGIRECCRRAHTYIRGHEEGPRLARRNLMRLLMVMAVAVRENLRKRSSGKQAMLDNLRQVAEYLTVDLSLIHI
eukprot:TRINITY_DN12483_c0_g1_i4.p1 TRINITY_DN12483_c0_g1~~TRINITY_DN12483_c0_g1_i4.p1  ORF type:complete len:239 (+),score=59.08 TRINITY_DN12483_c0_g1_i4:50-766(+)